MLNFIYSIPENLGWTLVGALAALAIELSVLVVKTITNMIREYKEEKPNE